MAQANLSAEITKVILGNQPNDKAFQSIIEYKFLSNFFHSEFMGLYTAIPLGIQPQGGTFLFRQINRPVPQIYDPAGTPTIYNPDVDTQSIRASSAQTLPLELNKVDLAGFATSTEAMYNVASALVGNFIAAAGRATWLHLNAELTQEFKDTCKTAYLPASKNETTANLFTLPKKASQYKASANMTETNTELWQWLADKAGILEEKITMKAVGIDRSRIHIFLDNRLYKNLTMPNGIVGVSEIAKATIGNIPMEQIIAGIHLHKHILLNQKFVKADGSSDGKIHKTMQYDFSVTEEGGETGQTGGIAALMFAEDSFALPMNFNQWLPATAQDSGFPRLIGHYQYGKGIIRPDFCFVIRYKKE